MTSSSKPSKTWIFRNRLGRLQPMKKKQYLLHVKLVSQFSFALHMSWVDVLWKSLRMKMIFVLTCVLRLRQVLTTLFLLTLISSDKSVKSMPFQTDIMSSSLVSWSISNALVSTQVTPWRFILLKLCRKRYKKLSQTTPNVLQLASTVLG